TDLARTHRVWVPDIPGFGLSSLPREDVSFEVIADVLCEGLTKISSSPILRLDIVGFSLGATLACYLASAWPSAIGNFVLVGCNLVGPSSTRLPGLINPKKMKSTELQRQAYRNNLALMMFSDSTHIDDSILDLYIEDCEIRTLPSRFLDVDKNY